MSRINPRVAFLTGAFGGGGIERVTARLAHSFVNLGIDIDLISNADSPHLWRMPSETRIIDMKARRLSMNLPEVVRYLRQESPSALLATDHYLNELGLVARFIAGVKTRVVVAEHNQLSKTVQNATRLKHRLTPISARVLYPWADGIVAVSKGVAKDLAQTANLPLEDIQTIYNPVTSPEMFAQSKEPIDHPWFKSQEIPVILGVGKLEAQKDFPNLIRAFSKVRQVKEARLVILGWGPDRPQLETLIKELGLQSDVDLLGYVQNPYAYMARSTVFVLSSAWEGLPTVLIEAMALGIPVVSTDCESGPSEILSNGQYGHLVAVGDSDALSNAILEVLSGHLKPIELSWLDQFGLKMATQKYLNVLGIPINSTCPL